MGSRRSCKRKTELRRKCDRCDLRFYSHFCLLLHLKVHLRSGWFPCSICKKPFEALARFLKHGKRHIARVKPKRLHRTRVNAIIGDTPLLGDVQSQIMLTPSEPKVPHTSANKLEGAHSSEITENNREEHQLEINDGITSEDKILKAAKFVEQLKALLKLDDQSLMETQAESNVSDSLQVSEVTSSNLNGVADSSSGTESEVQTEISERKDTKIVNCRGNPHQVEHCKVNLVSKEEHIISDNGFTYYPCKTKRVCSDEASCDTTKRRLLESNQIAMDLSGTSNKTEMATEKSLLPTTKFSCAICRSRFFSYSQLKRHKRVIHKLYNKTSDLNGPKMSNVKELQPYHCTFCLYQVNTVKKLQQHLRTTHNVTHKASKLWMKSSKNQSFETLNFFKQNSVDLGANCIDIKPGHFECSLCGAFFLTYKGYRDHLKKKHNVSFSQLNGNKLLVDAKSKRKKCGKQDSAKDNSKSREQNVDKIEFSQDCGGGYDSDTNKTCQKCESVFDSVKERREHELKSHGLKVYFEGEQFAFMQIDMKLGALDMEKSSKASEQKKLIIDDNERFFNKLTNSCKLCSTRYVAFSSLQRHMLERHNVKAYKLLPSLYKTGKVQGVLPEIRSNTDFPGGTEKECKLGMSSFRSKNELTSKKQMSNLVSARMVEIDSSKLGAPLSISKVPGKQLDFISKKMGTSPRNLLIYRLEGLGSKLKGSTKMKKSQHETKILVVKVKPPAEKQRNGTGSRSSIKEVAKVTGKRDGTNGSFPKTAKSMPYKAMHITKSLVSPDIGLPLNKAETVSLTQTTASNKDLLLLNREISPLCNGVQLLNKAKRSSSKYVNGAVVSSVGAETLSKMPGGKSISRKKVQNNSLGMSVGAANHVADDNGIEALLWSTSFTRKRFSCLICDVSFSGYNIQRKHMLNYHGIYLDSHGNRVNPSPSANQIRTVGADISSSTKKQIGDDSVSNLVASESNSLPVPSYEGSSMDNKNSQIAAFDDSLQPSTLCDVDDFTEDNYEVKTLIDGTKVYLCLYCPMHFKSLIDRLIHINDVHKSASTPLHENIVRSLTSSPTAKCTEGPSKESTLPTPSITSQKLPNQIAILKKTAGRSSQSLPPAKYEGDPPPGKKKWIDPPGIYRCHLCENIYKYYKGVYRHVKKFHKEQPLKRLECLVISSVDTKMLSKNLQCRLCKKKFRALNYLKTHMKCEHSTEIGNLESDSSSLHFSIWNAKESMVKSEENCSTHKQSRQIETVKSNLLAISIRDEPLAHDEQFDCNCNTLVDAQCGQEEEYIPVPPCDDESEFANEAVQVVENNLFSRLQANLIRSPKPIWDNEPTPSDHSGMSKGDNRESRNDIAFQSLNLNKMDSNFNSNDVDEDQEVASAAMGNMPDTQKRHSSTEVSQSQVNDSIQFTPKGSTVSENKHNISSCLTSDLERVDVVDGQTFVCTIPGCDKSFGSRRGYENHVSETCFLCHKRFSSAHNVRRHVREVHKITQTLACDLCGMEFPEPISLALHNRTEHLTPDMYVS